MPKHHGFIESALLVVCEALLLHGETRPLTGLPARATSAASKQKEGLRWVRLSQSLAKPQIHSGSLPAKPALVLTERIERIAQIERKKETPP
jgi:hypothetical protein